MGDAKNTLRIYKVAYQKKESWEKKYNTYSEETIFFVCQSNLAGDTIEELVENIVRTAEAHTFGQFNIIFSKPWNLSVATVGTFSGLNEAKNLSILEKIILKRKLKERLRKKKS